MTHQRRELITNLQFHFRIQWRAFVAIALRGPPKAPSACPRETTSNIRDTSWPARHLVTLAKRTPTMPSNWTLKASKNSQREAFYASSAAYWLIEPETWRCNLKRTRPRPGTRSPHAKTQQFRSARFVVASLKGTQNLDEGNAKLVGKINRTDRTARHNLIEKPKRE